MNKQQDSDSLRSLQILDELSRNGTVTQRDLSQGLGIALGLVNSYIKNLVKKGYVTVKAIPPKRYAYYLTPKGFAEKTRLTFDLLQDYTRIYREARTNLKKLFESMQTDGVRKVLFAGVDEVTELAYLTVRETGLELCAVVDDEAAGQEFFEHRIGPLSEVRNYSHDAVVVTSYVKREGIRKRLLEEGEPAGNIKTVFPD